MEEWTKTAVQAAPASLVPSITLQATTDDLQQPVWAQCIDET